VGLLERVADEARAPRHRDRAERRSSIDTWISDYLIPSGLFGYGGNQYGYGGYGGAYGLNQTWPGGRVQEIAATLPGYMAALRTCPPAFAAQLVRGLVLSQARLVFRNVPGHALTPRRLWSSSALALLERPWTNATTGELLSLMEWHAGLAGNAYVVRRPGRLRVLRPDWVAILYGSDLEPDNPAHALDGEVLGYVYANGGFGVGEPQTLRPADVAHWSPLRDPECAGVGMSWITPAVRDIQGDRAATDHKLAFFKQGATPNMVVKGLPTDFTQFKEIVELLEEEHAGVANAYKTLYLSTGADVTVVGKDLQQIDFANVQGKGETRISVLSRVPAPILGVSEGLAGSSLNAGNLGVARRNFSDGWIYPSLKSLAAALAPLVAVPSDSELWFDVADMPILREDAKDAADIEFVKAQTIRQLVDGGFTADSVIAAVQGQNMGLLAHTGLTSVQLNPPNKAQPQADGQGNGQVPAVAGSQGA
jgi:hypothetical protein